jgi:hypothetical protein
MQSKFWISTSQPTCVPSGCARWPRARRGESPEKRDGAAEVRGKGEAGEAALGRGDGRIKRMLHWYGRGGGEVRSAMLGEEKKFGRRR